VSKCERFVRPRTAAPVATVPSTLHIGLFEGFRLRYGDRPVAGVRSERLQSLLAYLLLHRDAPLSRQHTAFTFWPDSTEKQARTNLRQLLHRLRRALPDADRFIESDNQTLRWRRDAPFTLDVREFERALERADQADADDRREALEEALRLYRGDLLPGCYEDWIEPERRRLRAAYLSALDRLVHLLEELRENTAAIQHCRQLLRQDPLREETYRTLMRLHAAARDRTAALSVYEELASTVKRELGVEPSPATRDLYERLKQLEASPVRVTAPPQLEFPLVGQRRQWMRLQDSWREAVNGNARFVAITGEAGIGKTRLAEELLAHVAAEGHAYARSRSYQAEGRLAYGPITEWLRSDPIREGMRWLDPVWLTELARLCPELLAEQPELRRPEPLTEGWQRRHFFEALARAVLAAPCPLLLLLDDLQWCDRETLEWLRYLLHFAAAEELLVVGTARVEEIDPDHPFSALLFQLRRSEQFDEIGLGPLDREGTATLAERVQDGALDPERVAQLYARTEGNPLFIVECVRAGLATEPLPPPAQAVISYRLAQLTPEARQLAELGATIGRDFTHDVLAEACGLDEDSRLRALDELFRRRIIREHAPDACDFTHDKLREAAYEGIRPPRRRLLHRRVAEALESIRASDIDATSSQLASHYELAGLPRRAIPYYQRAADLAQRTHADEEAIVHLTRALEMLEALPEDEARDERELELQSALGSSLVTSRGWAAPEVGRAHKRARELCERRGASERLLPVLWGLQAFHTVRAELGRAKEIGDLLLRHAVDRDDAVLAGTARYTMAISLFHLGELVAARQQLEQIALADDDLTRGSPVARFGPLAGVLSSCYGAHVLFHLGWPDRALDRSQRALTLAEKLDHPFAQAIAHAYAAMLHQFRREPPAVQARAEAAAALCEKYGVVYYRAWADILRGWARAMQGDPAAGIEVMRRALADLIATGAELRRPYYLGLLAGVHAREGQAGEGLAVVAEALAVARRNGERWCEPELHRLQAELLRQRGDEVEAEDHFLRAVDLASGLQARALQLRAAIGLGRLRRDQGRLTEALAPLRALYDSYTEGFDTPDLQAAAALLHEPTSSPRV